ncbi:ribosomal RNA processing Brix domain protein [Actinidia rufa]|uniref:Ribosomal RNA processing Brix domain protein n=1 Tax=Actinidia rufa TaxID=165716 RepID=A0A7J0EXH0_9ERIC|nr:ribosomal RNA processing Brix domain protein [Actinidia rufa]
MKDKQDHDLGGIDALVEDRIRAEATDVTQGEEVRNFQKLLNDSQRELYPGSEDCTTLLKFVIEAFNIKENAMLDRCPRCNVSRYKINCGKGKKIPHKILRYFPLTPRLRRLFMSRMISKAMRWHVENPSDGEESRHPTHSDEWKDFDVKHPEFALEPRNVRLRLAVDGFNPFGNMSNSYRDKQPGIDIDVYMRPMVDELKELWQTGALTYDAFGQNHPEQRKRVAYNGKQEKRKRSLELPVEKIQEQLNNITGVILGKYPTNKKRPRYKPNWTKISILYELPYFKDKKFRHNIDVMQVEKNFSENLIGTMLGIDGKNKDTDKARKDLEDKGIRKELWLTQHPNGSYIKPRASFSLTIEEREAFFEFLKSVKYPDGYAANISRFLGALKNFVSNRARLEGSIAEAYIVKECITFCSMYLDGYETVYNRPERNEDYSELREGYTVFTEIARPIGLVTRDGEMSQELRDIAHWFVLFNSPEIKKYLEEHNNLLHVSNGQDITNLQRKHFPKWFKEQINRLRANNSKVANDELWSLANGPNLLVKEYSGCIVNGPCEASFLPKGYKMGANVGKSCNWSNKGGCLIVPEVRDGEPSDLEESSEAFQQESISSTLPIDIEDDIRYHREDVEVEVIERVGPLDETYDEDDEDHEIMGDNINNEVGDDDEVPDADDMDPDMDYDV